MKDMKFLEETQSIRDKLSTLDFIQAEEDKNFVYLLIDESFLNGQFLGMQTIRDMIFRKD